MAKEEGSGSSRETSKAEGIGSPYSNTSSTLRDQSDWEVLPVDADSGIVSLGPTTLVAQPNSNAEKLDEIAKGEEVRILGQTESFWYKVRYDWQEGYVLQPSIEITR